MQRSNKQWKRSFLKKLIHIARRWKRGLLKKLVHIAGAIAIGFFAGLLAQATFDPLIKPYLPWVKRTASVQIEVRYPDGRLVACKEITKVLLYKYLPAEQDFILFREEDSPLPVVRWDDIPPGRYAVEAYVTDMYAGGTGWDPKLPITVSAAAKRTITIKTIPQAQLRFWVYQRDGQTPLTGAWVEIRSHLGNLWRSGYVDKNGATAWFYLQPTNQADENKREEFYQADIYYDGKLIKSIPQITLDRKESREITVKVEKF